MLSYREQAIGQVLQRAAYNNTSAPRLASNCNTSYQKQRITVKEQWTGSGSTYMNSELSALVSAELPLAAHTARNQQHGGFKATVKAWMPADYTVWQAADASHPHACRRSSVGVGFKSESRARCPVRCLGYLTPKPVGFRAQVTAARATLLCMYSAAECPTLGSSPGAGVTQGGALQCSAFS